MAAVSSLQCVLCQRHAGVASAPVFCDECGGILLARYEFEALRGAGKRPGEESVGTPRQRQLARSMWRYGAVLPPVEPVTLGEGATPLVANPRIPGVWVKDEGANPGGTVAARGVALCAAMPDAGLPDAGLPDAGPPDAGRDRKAVTEEAAALAAAYSAAAGNRLRNPLARSATWHIEGLKTVGYELAEQLDWRLPDVVVCPAGDGFLVAALGKAFSELLELGWIAAPAVLPKLFAVEITGGPVRSSFSESSDSLLRKSVERTGGQVWTCAESAALATRNRWAAEAGVVLSLEGAVAAHAHELAATEEESGDEESRDKVAVLINPRSGWPVSGWAHHAAKPLPARMPVGGIITPQ